MTEKVIKVKDPSDLTEKQKAVVGFLQANAGEFVFAEDIANGIGSTAKSVSPILTGLAKREIVEKSKGMRVATLKAGTMEKEYVTYRLSEIGLGINL